MAQILIIEDERAVLSLLQRIVKHMGHDPVVAANGPEALALLAGEEPDLILSDLRMPGAPSGVELIRSLRARCPKLPIIVISGYASRDFLSRWPELGVDDFLPKPFDMEKIREVITRALVRATVPAL